MRPKQGWTSEGQVASIPAALDPLRVQKQKEIACVAHEQSLLDN